MLEQTLLIYTIILSYGIGNKNFLGWNSVKTGVWKNAKIFLKKVVDKIKNKDIINISSVNKFSQMNLGGSKNEW